MTKTAKIESASVVVLYQGLILLLQRPLDDKMFPGGSWCLPGGKMAREDHGDHRACALRELREETGLMFNAKRFLPHCSGSGIFNVETYRVLSAASPDKMRIKLSNEHIGYGWFNPYDEGGPPLTGELTKNAIALCR